MKQDHPNAVMLLAASVSYAGLVFAAGFLLGMVRVLLLAPVAGETLAVAAELPVMLLVSWLVCGVVLRRFCSPCTIAARIGTGLIAFLLLMLAEVTLSILGFGRSLGDHLAKYREPAAQLGLAGQIMFALIPVLRVDVGVRRATRSPSE